MLLASPRVAAQVRYRIVRRVAESREFLIRYGTGKGTRHLDQVDVETPHKSALLKILSASRVAPLRR